MTLNEIESLTKKLADAREELADIIRNLQAKQESLLRDRMPDVRRFVAKSADRHGELFAGIDGNRGLFADPQTCIFHGIRVGLRKGAGKITWDDPEPVVIGRIEDRFSKAEAEALIKTEKSLKKKGLADLDVKDLKAIGCRAEDTSFRVYIKPTNDAVDKIVNSLLKNAVDEAQKAAA